MNLQLLYYYETRDLVGPLQTVQLSPTVQAEVQCVLITGSNTVGRDENYVEWETIHQYNAPVLFPGQMLDIRGRAEIENPLKSGAANTNVECVTMCTISSKPLPKDVDVFSDTYVVAPAMGSNISLNAHYADLNFAAFFMVPRLISTPIIQWRVRCRHNPATFEEYAYIKPDYGFLQVATFG